MIAPGRRLRVLARMRRGRNQGDDAAAGGAAWFLDRRRRRVAGDGKIQVARPSAAVERGPGGLVAFAFLLRRLFLRRRARDGGARLVGAGVDRSPCVAPLVGCAFGGGAARGRCAHGDLAVGEGAEAGSVLDLQQAGLERQFAHAGGYRGVCLRDRVAEERAKGLGSPHLEKFVSPLVWGVEEEQSVHLGLRGVGIEFERDFGVPSVAAPLE